MEHKNETWNAPENQNRDESPVERESRYPKPTLYEEDGSSEVLEWNGYYVPLEADDPALRRFKAGEVPEYVKAYPKPVYVDVRKGDNRSPSAVVGTDGVSQAGLSLSSRGKQHRNSSLRPVRRSIIPSLTPTREVGALRRKSVACRRESTCDRKSVVTPISAVTNDGEEAESGGKELADGVWVLSEVLAVTTTMWDRLWQWVLSPFVSTTRTETKRVYVQRRQVDAWDQVASITHVPVKERLFAVELAIPIVEETVKEFQKSKGPQQVEAALLHLHKLRAKQEVYRCCYIQD